MLKVGIWTVKLKKSGFILLETLICLAILGILFPLTQKYIAALYQDFQNSKLKMRVVEIACLELSRMESSLELGEDLKEREKYSSREEINFLIQSEIEQVEFPLYKMTVHIQWQIQGKPQYYDLNQFYIPSQKEEEKNAPKIL